MKEQDLADLGLTPEDVLNKLVEKLYEHHCNSEEDYSSEFEKRLTESVRERVDETLAAAMEKHVLPQVAAMVGNICLQETNKWGEARGEKLTFVEYLTQRVDSYIREEVDYQGKAKERDSYHWSKAGTRISHMIHEHLRYSIEKAMTEALGEVNSSVRKGLLEAVQTALASVKVTVDTKVTK